MYMQLGTSSSTPRLSRGSNADAEGIVVKRSNAVVILALVMLMCISGVIVVSLLRGRPTASSAGAEILPEAARSAVDRFMATSAIEYQIGRVVRVPSTQTDYLVEMVWVMDKNERIYLWVDKEGKRTLMGEGVGVQPIYEKFEDGRAWFRCTMVADTFPTFPYYRATRPWENNALEAPCFTKPKDARYIISKDGLAYELTGVKATDEGISLSFKITGPKPGGVMAGGNRPPSTLITESGSKVTLVFSDVNANSRLAALKALSLKNARIESVATANGTLKVVIDVKTRYAIMLGSDEAKPDIETMRVLFSAR